MNSDFGSGQQTGFSRVGSVPGITFDAGLRQYMLGIYNNMSVGVAITGLAAWFAGQSEAFRSLLFTQTGISPVAWLVFLAPLAYMLVFLRNDSFASRTAAASRVHFYIYSLLMGLSMFTIFLVYTHESVVRAFFVTSATFAATSLWGYTTKRDLTGMGHFLIMGLIGIVIASIANIFMASTALQFGISVLGVLIFTGMTAWDTQQAKELYAGHAGQEANDKLAVRMALQLYLDFINLFLYLLRFFGQQRN